MTGTVPAGPYDPPVLLAALDADRVATLGLLLVIGLRDRGRGGGRRWLGPSSTKVIAMAALILGLAARRLVAARQPPGLRPTGEGRVAGSATAAPCEFLGLKVDVKLP